MANRAKEQAPVGERVVLDARHLEPFEIGAQLEALVSHPDKSPEGRQAVANAICADIVAQRIEQDPTAMNALRDLYPHYAKSRNRTSLGSQGKRWGRGLTAGVVFLKQIEKASLRDGGVRADDKASLPLQTIAEFMWPVREQGDEINYETRIHDALRDDVRRFHPVAHLVAAYQFAGRCADAEGLRMEFDYDNLAFHRAIVMLAATFARYIRDTPQLARAAAQLIEIEWSD